VVGSAIAAIVLLSVALAVPMRIAAWGVLLPLAVGSLGIALVLERGSLEQLSREAIIPASLAVVGLALADAAAIARGTVGPISLAIFDAWDYIPMDAWLQFHTTRDHVSQRTTNLVDLFGSNVATGHVRIGISAVNAAFASLFGAHPDETHLAFLAILFSLIPAGIWFLARSLGAGKPASAFGATFGLSASIFTLVADSTLGNLYALVIAPTAVVLAIHGLVMRSKRELALGAVVLAGLVAVYPEFLTFVSVAVLVGLFLNAVWSWRGKPRDLTTTFTSLAIGAVTYVLVLAAVSPVAGCQPPTTSEASTTTVQPMPCYRLARLALPTAERGHSECFTSTSFHDSACFRIKRPRWPSGFRFCSRSFSSRESSRRDDVG
jgi:hypothetical protein